VPELSFSFTLRRSSKTTMKIDFKSLAISILEEGLTIAGDGDISAELDDIFNDLQNPSEANLDKTATDLGVMLKKRIKFSDAQINSIVTLLIGGIALVTAGKAALVANVETEVTMLGNDVSVFVPNWKITPEHWTATMQALKDDLSDFKIQ